MIDEHFCVEFRAARVAIDKDFHSFCSRFETEYHLPSLVLQTTFKKDRRGVIL